MKCKRRFMHGKRRKRSPLHQEVEPIATAHATDPTVKGKSWKDTTSTSGLEVEPSDHPRYIGGSAPNPAKTAVSLAKNVYKGIKSLF